MEEYQLDIYDISLNFEFYENKSVVFIILQRFSQTQAVMLLDLRLV
jgi:hypothetical protein